MKFSGVSRKHNSRLSELNTFKIGSENREILRKKTYNDVTNELVLNPTNAKPSYADSRLNYNDIARLQSHPFDIINNSNRRENSVGMQSNSKEYRIVNNNENYDQFGREIAARDFQQGVDLQYNNGPQMNYPQAETNDRGYLRPLSGGNSHQNSQGVHSVPLQVADKMMHGQMGYPTYPPNEGYKPNVENTYAPFQGHPYTANPPLNMPMNNYHQNPISPQFDQPRFAPMHNSQYPHNVGNQFNPNIQQQSNDGANFPMPSQDMQKLKRDYCFENPSIGDQQLPHHYYPVQPVYSAEPNTVRPIQMGSSSGIDVKPCKLINLDTNKNYSFGNSTLQHNPILNPVNSNLFDIGKTYYRKKNN